jgi:muramidase (phage lysozyme)
MCRISVADAGGANMCAFLDMIAVSEIGSQMLADPRTDDGYKVLVGAPPGHLLLLGDYADHPRVRNAALNSDAAGRYQILSRYWPIYKKQLGLPDFGPESQDRYAIQQIKESRAIPAILTGDIVSATRLCARIWASLPGALYGQHVNNMDSLAAAYNTALGAYTA